MKIINVENVLNSINAALNLDIDNILKMVLTSTKELIEKQFELSTFQSNDICKYCRYCDNVVMAPGMVEDKVGMVVEYCKGCGSKNGFDKFRGKLIAEVIEDE